MSKILFILVLAVCSSSFAKGTAPGRHPANAVDALAPLADTLAPLPEKACVEAFKSADSGKVADAEEAAEVCNAAVAAHCAKENDGTGDGRYVSAYCRAQAAYGAYKTVKGKK